MRCLNQLVFGLVLASGVCSLNGCGGETATAPASPETTPPAVSAPADGSGAMDGAADGAADGTAAAGAETPAE